MQFAVAHLFLYGLLKDWVLVWTDSTQPKERPDVETREEKGTTVRHVLWTLPTYIKRKVLARLWAILPTRMYNMGGLGLFRYAFHWHVIIC